MSDVTKPTKPTQAYQIQWVAKSIDVDRRLWPLVASVAAENEKRIREAVHEALSRYVADMRKRA